MKSKASFLLKLKSILKCTVSVVALNFGMQVINYDYRLGVNHNYKI